MDKIVVFGASGDLAKRKILPALSRIKTRNFKVYGYARSDLTNNFSTVIREFYNYSDDFPESVIYIRGEYSDLSPLKEIIDSKTAIYLSLPPSTHYTVLKELSKYNPGLICIEKPFGESRTGFKQLLEFKSGKVRFIDHYLLKPMMIALPEISRAHPSLFKAIDRHSVQSVECIFAESILAEGRSYFDKNGMIKDVMQNHLTEVLASVLCQDKENIEVSRLEFIRQATIDKKEHVFGQYSSYSGELGEKSKTETFAALKCYVNNEAWKDVPFVMIAGKGLDKKATEIRFNLKREKHSPQALEYAEITDAMDLTRLVFNVAPENEIYVQSGDSKKIICGSEEISRFVGDKTDYEIIFSSMIDGRYFPSVSFEEAEELWRMFDDVLMIEKVLFCYETGMAMPKEALEILKKHR